MTTADRWGPQGSRQVYMTACNLRSAHPCRSICVLAACNTSRLGNLLLAKNTEASLASRGYDAPTRGNSTYRPTSRRGPFRTGCGKSHIRNPFRNIETRSGSNTSSRCNCRPPCCTLTASPRGPPATQCANEVACKSKAPCLCDSWRQEHTCGGKWRRTHSSRSNRGRPPGNSETSCNPLLAMNSSGDSTTSRDQLLSTW
mmetsp:Transcript_53255/g.114402  ORF Transcript_53255/g.114402 Transcript_53255/m.114402 type:complete len:200 (+) Transcript_53255:844-1443(+)